MRKIQHQEKICNFEDHQLPRSSDTSYRAHRWQGVTKVLLQCISQQLNSGCGCDFDMLQMEKLLLLLQMR